MELITDLKKTIQYKKKIISSHLVKLQHGYMEEQIKSTMQFFFYILKLTILINQCFIAQNFILTLYMQPVQMNITTNLKTLIALCVTLISFKCSQKSKRYVGITHTFEIENMHFSHKFCNFTRTFVYKFLELILYRYMKEFQE